jgi:methyl-accepting chemotaxis protein
MPIFKMSMLQENVSKWIACRRMIVEFPEYFQRKRAVLGAMALADHIMAFFSSTLPATRDGYENSEEQNESVRDAANQLHMASTTMRENISQTQGVEIEWSESISGMTQLVAGMRERTGRMEELVERLADIQATLDELGFLTNMSSLNAIVNATRTASSGKIFAAVAEEARKASNITRERIKEVFDIIAGVNQAITRSAELFTAFDTAMTDFRSASDQMMALSNDTVAFSQQQEAALQKIGSAVSHIGGYTRESRNRYRTISSTESHIRGYIENLDHIQTHRFGFFGPYRLDKTVSLDNQRKNIVGVDEVVRGNQELIEAERLALTDCTQDIEDADARLKRMSESYRQVVDTAARADRIMAEEVFQGLAKIQSQSREFGGNIDRIGAFMDSIETIKSEMQQSILFNDMLPLVAGMASLMVEGDHDLQFSVQELNALLVKLRNATRGIDKFLKEARRVLAAIDSMHREMITELRKNEKAAQNFSRILTSIVKTSEKHTAMFTAIGTALAVIRHALSANSECRERIESVNRQLTNSIADYIDILNYRSNRQGAAASEKAIDEIRAPKPLLLNTDETNQMVAVLEPKDKTLLS